MASFERCATNGNVAFRPRAHDRPILNLALRYESSLSLVRMIQHFGYMPINARLERRHVQEPEHDQDEPDILRVAHILVRAGRCQSPPDVRVSHRVYLLSGWL